MSLLPIYLLGSPVLREKSSDVESVDGDIRQFVADLFETMKAANGIGLAANQVGRTIRVAVVRVDPGDDIVLINPVITSREGKEKGEEGCLSIPEIYGDVERAVKITFETTSLDGERVRQEVRDMEARAVLHEIDHLDGVLFLDHLSPLKRRMLLKKWKKLRKDDPSLVQEVTAGRA